MDNVTERQIRLEITRAMLDFYKRNQRLAQNFRELGLPGDFMRDVEAQVVFLQEVQRARPGELEAFLSQAISTYEALLDSARACRTAVAFTQVHESDALIQAATFFANDKGGVN